jgi:hypothetical protein
MNYKIEKHNEKFTEYRGENWREMSEKGGGLWFEI